MAADGAQTSPPSADPSTDSSLPRRSTPIERPRVPLVLKLFGITALVIVLVIGVSVGLTVHRANKVATATVEASLTSAAKLFRELERNRLGRLELPNQILGNDSFFAASMKDALDVGAAPAPAASAAPAPASEPAATTVPAAPVIDMVSILDQLEQRREAFGTSLVMLLDNEGRVIARTDQPAVSTATREDLYEKSMLVRRLVDEGGLASSGVLVLGRQIYHASIAPVGVGTPVNIVAYLVSADEIDEQVANAIAQSTKAEVVFFSRGTDVAVRSSNAPSVGMQGMPGVEEIFRGGMSVRSVQVERNRYVMTGEPLRAGTEIVGAAVFLRSLDRELAPFREIERTLYIGGGLAMLLAFLLSWVLAKRLTRPIEQLAGMAQAVTAGDYSVQPDSARNDEVGILGRSFAKMINSLRDKAELEELYAQMADREENAAVRSRPIEAARLHEGTVMVTDLRGLPPTVGEGDAASVVAVLQRAMRTQEAEMKRQDGEVCEINGHRLVGMFRGERGIIHAIRAARAINEELATHNPPMTLGVGIATGEFVTGSVELDRETGTAIVGNAAQAAGTDIVANAQRREVRLDWVPVPLPVAAMPLLAMNTAVMRSLGASTMSTMKIGATGVGIGGVMVAIEDLPSGHVFGNRYRIEQVLGRGGMGVVYRATDIQLDEVVAIKMLTGDVMTRSPEDLERFKREIRLARKITNRNVLRTYDYGEAEGVYFISMEFVRGYTLSELLEQALKRQMAPRLSVGIARQICRGLQAAHEQGIIHRDIKPQNVLIDAKGEVKLMDFGIARMTETTDEMTQAGLIIGTPHYMSPEQVHGQALDARSDIYSMGVLLYEILVGRRPFESSSLTGVLTAHVIEAPLPPIELRPEIGKDLNALILQCLAKAPAERFSDAGALLAKLDEVQVPAVVAVAVA